MYGAFDVIFYFVIIQLFWLLINLLLILFYLTLLGFEFEISVTVNFNQTLSASQ